MPVVKDSANVHVLVNLECRAYAFTSEVSLPAKEEEGDLAAYSCFMRVLYVGAVEGNALSVAVCVAVCVSVLCVGVCLWDMCSASLLVKSANGKAAAGSLSLDRGPRSPSAPDWATVARQEEILSWRWWPLFTSLNTQLTSTPPLYFL